MENVLKENEELRQAQLERLRQHTGNNLGPMGPLNAELLAEMNERVEVIFNDYNLFFLLELFSLVYTSLVYFYCFNVNCWQK